MLYSVADTGYLSGKFVKDGKPALAKYHSDDVADVLEVISQQRDRRNDCTDAGNNRAECAKQCHESAAQFCGHWAYRRTQYVQPCAADIQSWAAVVRKHLHIRELDRETVDELIDRIEVGEKTVIDGKNVRDIKIYYRFVGNI